MASSFVLERRINGGSWELLASLDGGQFSYIDLTAIDIGSQYEYRIKKIYDWGAESEWSNITSMELAAWLWKGRKLTYPSSQLIHSLAKNVVYPTTYTLKFYGDVIERKVNGGTWQQINVNHSKEFLDTDIVPGNTYTYRVKRERNTNTSDWSNEVSVIVKPTVTFTVTAHGEITDTGGENCTKRGFVYSKVSHSTPGNVAPIETSYDNYVEEVGNFAAGPFFSMWRG